MTERFLFHTIAPRQIRFLTVPSYKKAAGLAALCLRQMEQDFVIGPPVTLHISNPELMAGIWSLLRECRVAFTSNPADGETVAEAVSDLNRCPYCIDTHAAMLSAFGPGGRPPGEGLRAWGAATATPGAAILRNPPFQPASMAAIAGTAVAFHYLNRMANIFLSPAPFLVRGKGWHKDAMVRIAGSMLRPRLTAQYPAPGQFLTVQPGISLPEEFGWAASEPIAGGLLRFVDAVEKAGSESVSPAVRELLMTRLAVWRGEPQPLGGVWIRELTEALPDEERPAACLALLAAFSSHQTRGADVANFRRHCASDRDLVNVTAWASYVAVRRIASWLAIPAA